MSQRSRFENRAKLINKAVRKDDTLPPAMSQQEAWAQVRTKEQVEQFYQLYYPHYPDIMCKAIADYYDRAIRGEVKLPEQFTTQKIIKKGWDFEEEINELKKIGQINNTIKNLEELSLVATASTEPSGPVAKIE